MEIVKNATKLANRGKMGHIDSANRSKNVVGIVGVYYCKYSTIGHKSWECFNIA